MTLPSFKNPPVNEVACGVRFEPLEGFTLPHMGLFWHSVRKNFPLCEHAPPLATGFPNVDQATGLPVPRIWLINSKQDRLIQMQNDAFYYNWRRKDSNLPYPRYDNIIKQFKRYIKIFLEFLKEHNFRGLTLKDCELTYINHMPPGEVWSSTSDFGKVFPDFTWRSDAQRFLPVPNQVAWKLSFSLPDSRGTLGAKVEQGTRKIDSAAVWVFELSARAAGTVRELDDVWDWFDVGHEWIVRGFADLTGSEIQQENWQRDDSFTS